MANNGIFKIENVNQIFELPESDTMTSSFDDKPNINKDILIHLLKGKPVVDLSDGEYIHWLQLDKEAINYIKDLN